MYKRQADDRVHKQDEEVSEVKWLALDDALNAVTFKNDKNLISRAKSFLMNGQSQDR